MTTTRDQSNLGSASPMSRVEWAIARYNWYRACGLLDDLPQQTTSYQRSPDPPPPKPHLKWYPLSKPDDDIAATYQQPVAATQRHRYSQQADNAHPQTVLTRGRAEKAPNYDSSTWSRVDWAIARYNWYRACGLLDDFAPPTAETTRYQRSPDPPSPQPDLKWYPLSKSDDETARTNQRSVIECPPEPQSRYCQRVEHARARAMLARYQTEKAAGSGNQFDPTKHPRAEAGQSTGGQFIRSGEPRSASRSEAPVDSSREGSIDQGALQSIYPQILLADASPSSLAFQLAIASLADIPHEHHIFARQFGSMIEGLFKEVDADFNIDHYTTTVDKLIAHQATSQETKNELRVLSEAASKGGYWNSELKLIKHKPGFAKLTSQEKRKAVLESILSMAKEMNFDLTDLTKWGSKKTEDNAKSIVNFLKLCAEAGVDEKTYGKQLGKLVAKSLETEVGRQMLKEVAPEIAERFVRGGLKGLIKNGAGAALKKAFGPLSAFMIAMAMQNGDVEAAVCDAANIPPEGLDQLKALMQGDASFDLSILGMTPVDSAGTLRVGQRAECSINGKNVGFVNVLKILDAGGGTYLVTVSGEKGRFIQLRVDPSTHNHVQLPADFRYFSYGLIPEMRIPDPVWK